MMDLPYAEKLNYWKTSQSSPDTWIDRAEKQIQKLGGKVYGHAFGTMPDTMKSAYMLTFEIEGERFKIIWPVLPSKTNNEKAAKRQAATFLFHDVKARCLSATVIGVRTAFFSYLLLPDGMTAAQHSLDEINELFPKMLGAGQ